MSHWAESPLSHCHIVQDNPKMVFTTYAALKYFFWHQNTLEFSKIIKFIKPLFIKLQSFIGIIIIKLQTKTKRCLVDLITIFISLQITIYSMYHHIILYHFITISITSAVAIFTILLSRYTYDMTITKTTTFQAKWLWPHFHFCVDPLQPVTPLSPILDVDCCLSISYTWYLYILWYFVLKTPDMGWVGLGSNASRPILKCAAINYLKLTSLQYILFCHWVIIWICKKFFSFKKIINVFKI